ncbi:hypothetical protein PtA15_5A690 [Puccinia triticina]|uniref:Uncharacterized protein n=1 Tax=Puccinia triticina TaxID=208348 RepID=A0ABY7CIS1_9BASI|nr:uncharacterized protein PtA15_5A690 [Puccinia triticina]WAQ85116.1 hypothetical protein PtA15_5A690 [Puccinia triticina]
MLPKWVLIYTPQAPSDGGKGVPSSQPESRKHATAGERAHPCAFGGRWGKVWTGSTYHRTQDFSYFARYPGPPAPRLLRPVSPPPTLATRQDPQSQPSIGQEEPTSNPGCRPFLSAHGPSPHQLAPLSARTPPQSGVPRTSHARPSDDVGHQDARMRVCRRAPGRRAPTRIAGPQPRSKNKMYMYVCVHFLLALRREEACESDAEGAYVYTRAYQSTRV